MAVGISRTAICLGGACVLLLLQVRLTGGLQQMLPSILPSFLFNAPQPIEKLVLDDERHILYSLASNNTLQVSTPACGCG